MIGNKKLFRFLVLTILLLNVQAWSFFGGNSDNEKKVDAEEPVVTDEIVKEDRVHDHKLSDQSHYVDTDNDGKFEHNSEYDHEAFLGKEESDKFKQLTPEESKARLGNIVDKIDMDKDGSLTVDELQDWIKSVNNGVINSDVDARWEEFKAHNTLEEYLDMSYGALSTWSDKDKVERKEDYQRYLKMMERDKKKFKAADHDKDGKLSKKEYTDFLHPEESPAMRDIVIDETLGDIDENGDGLIDIDEFIRDITKDLYDKTQEPDWVKHERSAFNKFRDTNNDNVLDREELGNWIMPKDYDKSLSEAQHLIHEADANKDGKLTKEEIIEKYSVFVASTATNYGSDIYDHQDL